jgi:D-alanyl-D-alanine carboxypeptidase
MKRYSYILFIGICLLPACSQETTTPEKSVLVSPELNKEYLYERFDFTEDDFEDRLTGLSSSALNDPEGFLETAAQLLEWSSACLLLVDKSHSLDSGFQPEETVDLATYPEISRGRDGLFLDRKAAEEFVRLSKAAEADGVTLIVSSAYRSFDYQNGLFRRFAERDGEDAASRYSARAGMSQHQLGTTIDLGDITNAFAQSEAGVWMNEKAGYYGWSLSYPQNLEELTGYTWESWHWRWIGVDAVKMQENYFDGIQQNMLVFWNKNAPVLTEALIH